MSHSFEVKHLSNESAIMVCKCGLTYQWRSAGYWKQVGFEDVRGKDIDPPAGQCNTNSQVAQSPEGRSSV